VYCRCAHWQEIPADVKDAALKALAEADAPFEAVCDLCGLAARHDGALAAWANDEGLRIVACRPRAIRWLFHAGGAELGDADAKVVDLRDLAPETAAAAMPSGTGLANAPDAPSDGVLHVVLYEGPGARTIEPARRVELLATLLDAGFGVTRTGPAGHFHARGERTVVVGEFPDGVPAEWPGESGQDATGLDITDKCACGALQAVQAIREQAGLAEPGQWVPWFPVVDYDRCVGCKQCANFCLFGVYEIADDPPVRVVEPSHCKTNCPACARICPKAAIIFPKYPSGPIDGSAVNEADVQAERVGTDLKTLLRGDVYNVLRRRSAAAGGADLASLAEKAKGSPDVLRSLGLVDAAAAKRLCDCDCGDPDPAPGGCACEAPDDDGKAEPPCCE